MNIIPSIHSPSLVVDHMNINKNIIPYEYISQEILDLADEIGLSNPRFHVLDSVLYIVDNNKLYLVKTI